MKTITLISAIALLLFNLLGTTSSVGGPMSMLLISFLTMLAVGIYEAVSQKRGPGGWIVNIFAALVGGFIAVALCGSVLETLMTQIRFEGQLATSSHALRFLTPIIIAVFTVVGSWIPLKIINRFR